MTLGLKNVPHSPHSIEDVRRALQVEHWNRNRLEDDVKRTNIGGATELTISSGAVTVTAPMHFLDTEGGAALDDLDTISGGVAGDVAAFFPADSSRVVWVTDADNISTPGDRHYPMPMSGARLFYDGTSWRLFACGDFGLIADTTINLDNSMSASTIQGLIDQVPKNMSGHMLTYQFADGTYTLAANLEFADFSNGRVFIYGNTGESGLHTNQAVYLDFNTANAEGIVTARIGGPAFTKNLKIRVNSGSYNVRCISQNDSLKCFVDGCYLLGTGTGNGMGVQHRYELSDVRNTYVSNLKYGLDCLYGRLYSAGNDDTGTPPA